MQVASRTACSDLEGSTAERWQQHDANVTSSSSSSSRHAGEQQEGKCRQAPGGITAPAHAHAEQPPAAHTPMRAAQNGRAAPPDEVERDLQQASPPGTGAPSAAKGRPIRMREGTQQQHGGWPGVQSATDGPAAGSGSPERLKPGPVFVPIVLCMDDDDHELLVDEWHARERVRYL